MVVPVGLGVSLGDGDWLEGRQGGQAGLGQLHAQQADGQQSAGVCTLLRGVGARALPLLLQLLLHVGRQDPHLLHLVVQRPGGHPVLSAGLQGGHAWRQEPCQHKWYIFKKDFY